MSTRSPTKRSSAITSSYRKEADFLKDVREIGATVLDRSRRLSFKDFASRGELRDSLMLRLVLLGEAANRLTKKTKDLYPEASFSTVARLRHLVRDYWSFDHVKTWKVIQEDVPQLLDILARSTRP